MKPDIICQIETLENELVTKQANDRLTLMPAIADLLHKVKVYITEQNEAIDRLSKREADRF